MNWDRSINDKKFVKKERKKSTQSRSQRIFYFTSISECKCSVDTVAKINRNGIRNPLELDKKTKRRERDKWNRKPLKWLNWNCHLEKPEHVELRGLESKVKKKRRSLVLEEKTKKTRRYRKKESQEQEKEEEEEEGSGSPRAKSRIFFGAIADFEKTRKKLRETDSNLTEFWCNPKSEVIASDIIEFTKCSPAVSRRHIIRD